MMKPWKAPMAAPSATPIARARIQVYGWSNPRPRLVGIQTAWSIAITYPVSPRIEPTDRSMLRDTMMSTIPVAMTAMEELWTDRFQRFRVVRKPPPDMTSNPTQMTARATTMPSRRVSTSRENRIDRIERRVGSPTGSDGTPIASGMVVPHAPFMRSAPSAANRGRGAIVNATAAGRLAAGGNGAGLDALAERGLGDPPRVEDDVEVVLGDRLGGEEDRRQGVLARAREGRGAGHLGDVGVGAELGRCLTGSLAEEAGVLPDVHGLRAEGDPVQGGGVAVLARDRNLAREALGRKRGHDAAGHAVVLGENSVNLVVVGRQDLLHLLLSVGRIPVVGVGLADDLDVGSRLPDVREPGLDHARAQEVGVGVGLVALDDREVALRDLGHDGLRLELADEDVVEGDVQRLRRLDEAVVGDDRDALADRAVNGRLDRGPVLGEDDHDLRALRDEVLDVRRLRLGRRLRVIRDVGVAGGGERGLDRRLVPLRPALLLVVVPRDADGAPTGGRARGCPARRGARGRARGGDARRSTRCGSTRCGSTRRRRRRTAARGKDDRRNSRDCSQLAIDHVLSTPPLLSLIHI